MMGLSKEKKLNPSELGHSSIKPTLCLLIGNDCLMWMIWAYTGLYWPGLCHTALDRSYQQYEMEY